MWERWERRACTGYVLRCCVRSMPLHFVVPHGPYLHEAACAAVDWSIASSASTVAALFAVCIISVTRVCLCVCVRIYRTYSCNALRMRRSYDMWNREGIPLLNGRKQRRGAAAGVLGVPVQHDGLTDVTEASDAHRCACAAVLVWAVGVTVALVVCAARGGFGSTEDSVKHASVVAAHYNLDDECVEFLAGLHMTTLGENETVPPGALIVQSHAGSLHATHEHTPHLRTQTHDCLNKLYDLLHAHGESTWSVMHSEAIPNPSASSTGRRLSTVRDFAVPRSYVCGQEHQNGKCIADCTAQSPIMAIRRKIANGDPELTTVTSGKADNRWCYQARTQLKFPPWGESRCASGPLPEFQAINMAYTNVCTKDSVDAWIQQHPSDPPVDSGTGSTTNDDASSSIESHSDAIIVFDFRSGFSSYTGEWSRSMHAHTCSSAAGNVKAIWHRHIIHSDAQPTFVTDLQGDTKSLKTQLGKVAPVGDNHPYPRKIEVVAYDDECFVLYTKDDWDNAKDITYSYGAQAMLDAISECRQSIHASNPADPAEPEVTIVRGTRPDGASKVEVHRQLLGWRDWKMVYNYESYEVGVQPLEGTPVAIQSAYPIKWEIVNGRLTVETVSSCNVHDGTPIIDKMDEPCTTPFTEPAGCMTSEETTCAPVWPQSSSAINDKCTITMVVNTESVYRRLLYWITPDSDNTAKSDMKEMLRIISNRPQFTKFDADMLREHQKELSGLLNLFMCKSNGDGDTVAATSEDTNIDTTVLN